MNTLRRLVLLVPIGWAALSAAEDSPCPPGYIPKPVATEEDERPPRLRRSSSTSPARAAEHRKGVECISVGPATSDVVLDKVAANVSASSTALPSFICDQHIDRYQSQSNGKKWKRKDRLATEVLWVDGKESYRNVRRDRKKLRNPSPAVSGTWSYGAFGSLMLGLFEPGTQALFEYSGEEEIRGVKAHLYDFTVDEDRSSWKVEFDGESVNPAYGGTIWIDPEQSRVLRIFIHARDLPLTFGARLVEHTVDYGPVEIAGREHLLVVHSAYLACKRYSRFCAKNDIAFRNYRQFTAAATMTHSSVEYEGPTTKK